MFSLSPLYIYFFGFCFYSEFLYKYFLQILVDLKGHILEGGGGRNTLLIIVIFFESSRTALEQGSQPTTVSESKN